MAEPKSLYPELLHLTEQACARLREGSHGALVALLAERETVVQAIRDSTPPPDPDAIGRILDVDRRLLDVLEVEKGRIAEALAQIAQCRRLLESYHGAAPQGPVYVETVG